MEKADLLERRWYEDPKFPCSVLTLTGTGLLFHTHWHSEIEILSPVDCTVELMVDGELLTLPCGGDVIVNSGQLHTGRLVGRAAGKLRLIVFHPELWLPGLADERLSSPVLALLQGDIRLPCLWLPCEPVAHPVLTLIRQILDLGPNPVEHRQHLAIRGLLFLLLSVLLQISQVLAVSQSSHPDKRFQIERIKAPLKYIHQNYSADLRLKQLAQLANISESHFSRLFRQVIGQSVIEYLVEYRLRQAARLLDSTDARITDVAINTGFANLSYFVRRFKLQYQLTPTAYRKRIRSELPS